MSQDFIPDNQFQPDQAQTSAAPASGSPSFIPDSQFQPDEQKYGSVPQQILTGVEGAAKGFAGPVATGLEAGLSSLGVPGLTPSDQAGRESANPWTHGISEFTGFGAGAATGVGEAALLEHAGAALVPAAVSTAGKIGTAAARGAIEMGLLQGGDEISKRINNDPEQTVGSVVAHIGLSSLIGAGGGAALGAIFPKWITEHQEPVEQGIQDLKNTLNGTVVDQVADEPIQQILQNAPSTKELASSDVARVAAKNEWPILEGMVSDNPSVKMAEDSLLRGDRPTIASMSRRNAYGDALEKVTNAVDSAASSASDLSETQVGQNMRDSIVQKLEDRYKPIKDMYDAIDPYRQAIPISDLSAGRIQKNIQGIFKDIGEKEIAGTARSNFVQTFAKEFGEVKNLSELASVRAAMGKTAGVETKDLAANIAQRVNGLEERAIGRFSQTMRTQDAKNKIIGIIDQARVAKKSYADYRDQLQELGNSLGKAKIYGPQNFMDFVEKMNPQTLTRRLFNENNTEFAEYFAKTFPEEFKTMRAYKRSEIRQGAMKDGAFSASKAVKSILDMEPETRALLFTPEEIDKIKDAQKYLGSFPKSFNPSGTAHMSAFREFFSGPVSAAASNITDAGMFAFIKAMGRSAAGAEAEAPRLLSILGKPAIEKDANAQAMKSSVEYLTSAIKGDQLLSRSARAIFGGTLPDAVSHIDEDRISKLDERLKEYAENPELNEHIGGQMGYYIPNHDIAAKGMTANAIQYLNSLRPTEIKGAPLDRNRQPSQLEKSNYMRALKIAESPLSVVSTLKEGRLTSQDLNHLNNLYPGFLNQMKSRIYEQMISHVTKEKEIPYQTRVGLSVLMGHPLDSSIAPAAILSNQAALMSASQAAQTPRGTKPSQPGLREMKRSSRLGLDNGNDDSE